jgi:hypothetical protein
MSAVLLPGMRAKPLSSTTLPRSQGLALASSAISVGASLWVRKRLAQIGTSAATTASCAAAVVWSRAVLLVTQPPQLTPMIMQATAPPMKPHARGLVLVGNRISYPFMAGMRPQDQRTRDRVAEDQQPVGDRSRKSGREREVCRMRTGERWFK